MSVDGPLLTSMNAARRMLRDCYWWRRLVDPANPWDEATAEAHIYFDALPKPNQGPDHSLSELLAMRPFAILWGDLAGALRITNDSTGYTCALPSGTLIMQIELPVPQALADQPTNLAIDLSRKFGLLMQTRNSEQPGLMELAGQSGYLPLREVSLTGYVRTEAKDAKHLGDAVMAELQLSWGID